MPSWLRKLLNNDAPIVRIDESSPYWLVGDTRNLGRSGVLDPIDIDFPKLFRALSDWLPDSAVVCLADGSPTRTIREFMSRNAIPEQLRVTSGAWPNPKVFHIPRAALQDLAEVAEHCAAPELANHVFAYREGVVLLAWCDAPFEPILLPGGTPEDHIHDLAARLGARYEPETA